MTKTLRRIEIEPLSEPRWSKIERGIFTRLELPAERPAPTVGGRISPMRVWLVAAALGALAVVAVVVAQSPDRAVADHPSRIATGVSASHLALPGLSLDVEPHSAVVIDTETPRGQLIVLDRGTIVCQVAPRSSGTPLIVQAGGTRVRVIGTRFRVTRLGETARVEVEEGTVEVTSRGGTWRVQGGEEWPPSLDVGSVATGANIDTGSDDPARGEAATPKPSAEEVESAVPDQRAAERVVPEKSRRPRAASPGRTVTEESEATAIEPEPTVATVGPSSQTVFERAAALERSDPGRASQLYRSLESGGDSWAQNALYARARLAASRGNVGEARRLLQQYLDRFPRGSNAEDARAVLRRLR